MASLVANTKRQEVGARKEKAKSIGGLKMEVCSSTMTVIITGLSQQFFSNNGAELLQLRTTGLACRYARHMLRHNRSWRLMPVG